MVTAGPSDLRLRLVDLNQAVVDACSDEFAAWPSLVVTARARLETVTDVDALITAGNSYGQMDGGVDRAIHDAYPEAQRSVWKVIAEQSRGYLPVGSAVVAPSGSRQVPWLVYAPTMRVPMSLTSNDVVVHDAFWAALIAIERHNSINDRRINSAACVGLGTGVGHVAPERAARLMATAFRCWRAGPTAVMSDRERDLSP